MPITDLAEAHCGSVCQLDGSKQLTPSQKASLWTARINTNIGGTDRVRNEGVGMRRVKTPVKVRGGTIASNG